MKTTSIAAPGGRTVMELFQSFILRKLSLFDLSSSSHGDPTYRFCLFVFVFCFLRWSFSLVAQAGV